MRGNKITRVDSRGRLKIPREFLAKLKEYGEEVYITSLTGQNAWIYPLSVWQEIERRVAELPTTSKARIKYQTRVSFFGNSTRIDAQGRTLLHPLLRESAGLEGELSILGDGNHLEVWAKDVLKKRIEDQGELTDDDYEAFERAGI